MRANVQGCLNPKRAARLKRAERHTLGQSAQKAPRSSISASKWRIRVCSGRASSRNNSSTATTSSCPSASGTEPAGSSVGTSRQTESQPSLALPLKGRQPQIMGMFEHRQRLAAIELHGELGAEVVKAFVALAPWRESAPPAARVSNSICRSIPALGLSIRLRTSSPAALRRAETCGQQTVDQRRLLMADAANLQVGAIGRLDHATGERSRASATAMA